MSADWLGFVSLPLFSVLSCKIKWADHGYEQDKTANDYCIHFSLVLSLDSHKPIKRVATTVIATMIYVHTFCMSLNMDVSKMAVAIYFAMSKSQSPNFFLITEQRYRNYSKHNASIRNHLNTPHHEHSTVYTPSTPNPQKYGHRTVHSTHQRGSSELPRHIPHRHTENRPVRTDISDYSPDLTMTRGINWLQYHHYRHLEYAQEIESVLSLLSQ